MLWLTSPGSCYGLGYLALKHSDKPYASMSQIKNHRLAPASQSIPPKGLLLNFFGRVEVVHEYLQVLPVASQMVVTKGRLRRNIEGHMVK
jgi:hypothetical protein